MTFPELTGGGPNSHVLSGVQSLPSRRETRGIRFPETHYRRPRRYGVPSRFRGLVARTGRRRPERSRRVHPHPTYAIDLKDAAGRTEAPGGPAGRTADSIPGTVGRIAPRAGGELRVPHRLC